MGSMNRAPRLLLVEDDEEVAALLRSELDQHGFFVDWISRGENCAETARQSAPDLILLDVHLGGVTGFEVAADLARDERTAQVPIIFLSNRDTEENVVRALERAAVYDFIGKGERTSIIVARIRNALRLAAPVAPAPPAVARELRCGALRLDPEAVQAWCGGQELPLTISELRFLQLLLTHPGVVFDRQAIIRAVHGEHYPATERSIDTLVKCLRQKLGSESELIETVRGAGYRLKTS